jgi:serine/threonine protein kinase/tetratricopeptide (TPR) repeat protein
MIGEEPGPMSADPSVETQSVSPRQSRRCDDATGRNLLFGILALQNNFIGRDALIAAFNAWVMDRSQNLGAILMAQHALTLERLTVLNGLVAEHLKEHQGNVDESLVALRAVNAVYAALRDIDDPDVQASLELGDSSHSGNDRSDALTALWTAERHAKAAGERFRVLRNHKKGGMGRILVASDLELNREVALKEIHPQAADDPLMRERFIVEAEITGGLEHPSIVPVYALGRYPNGRPFYAMRLIKDESQSDGDETLRGAIKRYHDSGGQAGEPPAPTRMDLRELLGRFIDICDAIQYAHHRGIIHRDLKPSNIVLGRFGETFVLDWGLAKLVDRAGTGERAETTLRPASAGSAWQTWNGSVVGTIGYMAPEQAARDSAQLGPACDIYGLGAILYAILTGDAPIKLQSHGPRAEREKDRERAISDTIGGRFRRPRAIDPKIPGALEAIALKAMATSPVDRYPSAEALSDDIKHWLADLPVSVYVEPLPVRAGRWMRRHKLGVALAGTLVLAALIGFIVDDLRVGREKQRVEFARAEAEQNFGTARAVVKSMLFNLARADLPSVPQADGLRLQMADKAYEFNAALMARHASDPDVRADMAEIDREVGNITRMVSEFDRASTAYDRALKLWRSLADEFPQEPRYAYGLAQTLIDAGELVRLEGRAQDAQKLYREAIGICDRNAGPIVRRNQPDLRSPKATAYLDLGAAQLDLGQFPEALDANRTASDLFQEIHHTRGATLQERLHLAIAQRGIGKALVGAGDSSKAADGFSACIRVCDIALGIDAKTVGTGEPSLAALTPDLRFIRAEASLDLGIVLVDQAKTGAAGQRQMDFAIRELGELREAKPRVTTYRQALADAYASRGITRLNASNEPAALADFQMAREILDGLLRDLAPGHAQRGDCGQTLGEIGRALLEHGNATAAAPILKRATEQEQIGWGDAPTNAVRRAAMKRDHDAFDKAQGPLK